MVSDASRKQSAKCKFTKKTCLNLQQEIVSGFVPLTTVAFVVLLGIFSAETFWDMSHKGFFQFNNF